MLLFIFFKIKFYFMRSIADQSIGSRHAALKGLHQPLGLQPHFLAEVLDVHSTLTEIASSASRHIVAQLIHATDNLIFLVGRYRLTFLFKDFRP